ncbi:MAG: serine/threonine protein kinase, partial [Myxococcales bacterium]|nr:serine/threonine protein kinase [Myxococcales bacterium]
MARNARDPIVGTVVAGRFHVKRPLATGGMAAVYVARDGDGGPRVALKLLAPPRRDAERMLALMQREGEVLASLEHPNIVRAIDHGPSGDGGYFIAMELVDGLSLTDWVRQKVDRPLQAVPLVLQLCSALRHVHGRGLVHRDLKASNVLVSARPHGAHVTLIDFGVAWVDDAPEIDGEEHLLGGVHTSSPEQIRGEAPDVRSDIYSVGVLLFRLLAGRYPYHSKLPAEVLTQHLHSPVPELPEAAGIPPAIRPVVTRCLQKDPDDRFPDVQALVEALSAAVEL